MNFAPVVARRISRERYGRIGCSHRLYCAGNVDVDANSTLNVDIGTGLSLTSDGGDINISGKHSNQAYGTLQNAGGGLVAVSTGTVTAVQRLSKSRSSSLVG